MFRKIYEILTKIKENKKDFKQKKIEEYVEEIERDNSKLYDKNINLQNKLDDFEYE